ncbi:MAG: hypothetical protein J6Y77_06055 [Paludibacteraceae bacterium]|nr:hypothetical protein [Paludibacteraceae bacterium]
MEKVISREIQLQDQNCDFSGMVGPGSVLSKFLETAGYAADRMGFGVEDMFASGRMWVVSRISAEWKAPVHKARPYRIDTWIGANERCMSKRHLEIHDAQDGCVARCTILWALLDSNTHRPLDLSGDQRLHEAVCDRPCDLEPERLGFAEGELVGTHRIAYSDIDFNRHANSIRYLEWVLDTYPREYHEQHYIKQLDINYLRESHWGDTVELLVQRSAAGDVFDLRIEGKAVCRARLIWGERK